MSCSNFQPLMVSIKHRIYVFLLRLSPKSCPHITPRPGKPGKIFWVSGPPGAGKSTTCQLLARKNDYVYYEADATMQLINPFVPIDADNPSLAQMFQKSLKVQVLATFERTILKPQINSGYDEQKPESLICNW